MRFSLPKKSKINKSGFGLIEVLVAIVILGVLVTGLTAVLSNMSRRMGYMTSKMGQVDLISDMHTILSNNALCTQQFAGTILGNVGEEPNIAFQINSTASISADGPSNLPAYGVEVQKLFLSDITAAGTSKNLPLFLTTVNLSSAENNFSKNKQLKTTEKLIFRTATVGKVYFQIDSLSSRKIISCFTTTGMDDGSIKSLCDMFNGTFNATTGKCAAAAKPCQMSDNPNINNALHNYVGTKDVGFIPDGVIGNFFGLGTNPHYASNVGVVMATDLSPADQAIVNQIKSGTIPSGFRAGAQTTNGVCVDGQWVDSGVVPGSGGGSNDNGHDGDGEDDGGDN